MQSIFDTVWACTNEQGTKNGPNGKIITVKPAAI
jgi:hypothetical protein